MSLENIRKLKEMANEPKPRKTYSIPKISKKRQKKLEEQKDMQKKDHDFYMEVWNASPHECQNCERKLSRIPSNWMFHHLLPKAKYPQFRYEPSNIAILCFTCHSKCETNIDFAPKIKSKLYQIEKELLG